MFHEEYLWFYISYVIIYISQRDYKDQTFFFNIVCFEFGDSGHCCIMFHSYAYFKRHAQLSHNNRWSSVLQWVWKSGIEGQLPVRVSAVRKCKQFNFLVNSSYLEVVYWIIWLDCGFLHNSESKKNYDSILILRLFYSV